MAFCAHTSLSPGRKSHATLVASECSECWAILQCNEICLKEYYDSSGAPSVQLRLEACERLRELRSDQLASLCEILEENPHALDFMDEYIVR